MKTFKVDSLVLALTEEWSEAPSPYLVGNNYEDASYLNLVTGDMLEYSRDALGRKVWGYRCGETKRYRRIAEKEAVHIVSEMKRLQVRFRFSGWAR